MDGRRPDSVSRQAVLLLTWVAAHQALPQIKQGLAPTAVQSYNDQNESTALMLRSASGKPHPAVGRFTSEQQLPRAVFQEALPAVLQVQAVRRAVSGAAGCPARAVTPAIRQKLCHQHWSARYQPVKTATNHLQACAFLHAEVAVRDHGCPSEAVCYSSLRYAASNSWCTAASTADVGWLTQPLSCQPCALHVTDLPCCAQCDKLPAQVKF